MHSDRQALKKFLKFGLKPKPLSTSTMTSTNQNCKQIKIALIAASAALLINNRRANYRREQNIHREGCISGESNRCIIWLVKKETAILADDYARWRSDIDTSCSV